MTTTNTARTLRRFNNILALRNGATTAGEAAAARAALVRMLNNPAHFRTLCGDHPLANIPGFSWEILDALKASWCDRANGRKGEEVVEMVLLRGFDWKELRNALRTHRATMRAQWQNGRYVGTENLKRLSCQEWALQAALRESARSEGMTDSEIARVEASTR